MYLAKNDYLLPDESIIIISKYTAERAHSFSQTTKKKYNITKSYKQNTLEHIQFTFSLTVFQN